MLVLPPVFTTLWSVPDRIVQNSGDAQLQTTYSDTKPIIQTASDLNDWANFIGAVLILAGLIGGGILGVKYLPALVEELVG